jgi:hypothetical protein
MKSMVEELLALIGGQPKESKPATPTARGKEKPQTAPATAAASTPRSKTRPQPAVKTKQPSPEQIIPLENEDFKDF